MVDNSQMTCYQTGMKSASDKECFQTIKLVFINRDEATKH
jgi:hypothetical protein